MSKEIQLENMMKQIAETCDRARRIETNMHKIREHIGMPAHEANKKFTVLDKENVMVSGYDVTIAKIKREMLSANQFELGIPVTLWAGDKEIAVISFLG